LFRQVIARVIARPSDRLALIVTVGVLLPFALRLVLALWWSLHGLPPINVDGDDALLELSTLRATTGEQLLGPYSRFDWHHPGPAYFYLLAPIYALVGHNALGLHWGALLINAASAAALLLLARRWGGPRLLYPVAAALAVHVAVFGAQRLSHPWNPFVAVLPFGLYLLLAGRLVTGDPRPLPGLVALGSFLVQTHLGYAPPVVLLAAASGVLALTRPAVPGEGVLPIGYRPDRLPAQSLAAATLFAVALWAPVVGEQLAEPPGNLALLWRFFVEPEVPRPPFAEVASGWALHVVGPALAAGATFDGIARILVGAALGLAQVALLIAALRRSPPTGAAVYRHGLAALGLVGLGASVLSAVQVRGEVEWYLLLWVGILVLLNWAVAAGGLAPPGALRVGAAAIVVGATAISLIQIGRAGAPEETAASHRIDQLYATLADAPAPTLVEIASPAQWQVAAGLVLRMQKEGHPVSVDGAGRAAFGPAFLPTGRERAVVTVAPAAAGAPAGAVALAAVDDVLLLETEPGARVAQANSAN
jgi:hypothetical protein